MRNALYLSVLFAAGAILSSCAKEDNHNTSLPEMKFYATIGAKDPTFKSLDADGKTAWVVGEKIAVYYRQTGDTWATAEANVDAVNDGQASISATLSGAIGGTTVKFVYPFSLHNEAGDIKTANLLSQHGTIDDISANFDAATGSGTLVSNGTTFGAESNIHLVNRIFVGKFTPKFNEGAIDCVTKLTITAGDKTYSVTPSAGTFGTDGIYVAMLPVNDQAVSLAAQTATQNYSFAGVKATFGAGKLYTNLVIPMSKGMEIDLSKVSGETTAFDCDVLKGTLGGNHKISIAAGATVTLDGVTIDGTNNSSYNWAGLNCKGDATIILKDGSTNNVKGFYEDYPGIHVPAGSTLTIKGEKTGTGSLTATSNTDETASGAGIGGGWNLACGNIEIQSGDITAYGSISAAGIGCNNSTCGTITISGGNVTATGGANAAGIGSGSGTCGNITISGGSVTSIGGDGGAGIGSGKNGGHCGAITIKNTVTSVTATKGNDSPCSIGYGYNSYCGEVTIEDPSKVTQN